MRQGMMVALKALVRSRRYRSEFAVAFGVHLCVHCWRVNAIKKAKRTYLLRRVQKEERRVHAKLLQDTQKLAEERGLLDHRVGYLSDWVDDLEHEKEGVWQEICKMRSGDTARTD